MIMEVWGGEGRRVECTVVKSRAGSSFALRETERERETQRQREMQTKRKRQREREGGGLRKERESLTKVPNQSSTICCRRQVHIQRGTLSTAAAF